MSILIGTLFIIIGLIGIFHPSFFYDVRKLNAEKVARNERIWNRCGIGLLILGCVDLALSLVHH